MKSGLAIIDKPIGMTSHDIVKKYQKIFSISKIGHSGTLDPIASGILVLGIRYATKILSFLASNKKSYLATIRLGICTNTDDSHGEIIKINSTKHITKNQIKYAIRTLHGKIIQIPSIFSSVKFFGNRAHLLSRKGLKINLNGRTISTYYCNLIIARYINKFIDVDIEINCSSGTYIRSIARDLGNQLGVGGHLITLRRNKVGFFTINETRRFTKLYRKIEFNYSLDEACLAIFPCRNLHGTEIESILSGKLLTPTNIKEVYVATDFNGHSIGLLKNEKYTTKLVTIFN